MARYIDADALIECIQKLKVVTADMYGMGIARGIERAETAIEMQPTADVVPKSEVVELEKTLAKCLPSYCQVMTEKKVMEIGRSQGAKTALLELKKQVHDHAVYPHNAGIDAYITLKAFDLVLNNFMKNYGG